MSEQLLTPKISSDGQSEDTKYSNTGNHPKTQKQKTAVLKAFEETPKTMLQAAAISGVMRSNICYYMKEFRQAGQIEFIRFGLCPLTKHRAGFYVRKEVVCK